MQSKNVTSRIFWPTDLKQPTEPPKANGFIVGWNSKSLVCTVAAIIPQQDIRLLDLERILRYISRQPALAGLWRQCTRSPTVLGEWEYTTDTKKSDLRRDKDIAAKKRTANFWVTMKQSSQQHRDSWLPQLVELYCCGYRYRNACQIIMYERPCCFSHKFLSATPFSFVSPSKTNQDTSIGNILHQCNFAHQIEDMLMYFIRSLHASHRNHPPSRDFSTSSSSASSCSAPSSSSASSLRLRQSAKNASPMSPAASSSLLPPSSAFPSLPSTSTTKTPQSTSSSSSSKFPKVHAHCVQHSCYLHTHLHTYVRTQIHAYIHTHVHKYIHTDRHTYLHRLKIISINIITVVSTVLSQPSSALLTRLLSALR